MTLIQVLTIVGEAGLAAVRDYEAKKDADSALRAAQESIADARAQHKFPNLEPSR
jgi:hypothetical protein